MDDASRLIGDLQLKLAHLDNKVAAYRQDMAAEFERYARDILHDVPDHLSAEVQRRLQDSLEQYPALGPELRRLALLDAPPQLADPVATSATNSISNPAYSNEQSATTAAVRSTPGSPPPADLPVNLSDDHHPSLLPTPTRERDVELQGLFTPSFLPLFDSAPGTPQSPASPPRLPAATSAAADQTTMGDGLADGGQPKARNQDQLQSASRASLTPPRPHHQRRATSDTTSSGTSEHSESKMPRSAMRRSSSGSKPPPSPRRVRFEFEGLEVLPTSSPQTSSEVSLVQSHSLHSSSSSSPIDPTIADEGEIPISSDALLGPDEDSTPPPKKVSSSQALRALSRTPLDANTIWTVVNAESPEPSSGNTSPRNLSSPSPSRTSLQSHSPLKPMAPPSESPQQRAKKALKSPPPEPEVDLNDDEDDSSDDDFLAMAKPKSFANKKAILSPVTRSPPKTKAPEPEPLSPLPPPAQSSVDSSSSDRRRTTPPRNSTKGGVDADDDDGDDEEDDFFHFEGGPPSKSRPLRPEPIEEEEEVDDADSGPQDAPTLYSTSPAVTVPKAQVPPPAHLIAGSVGSYRGRSVHMPVVKDPEVYAQAASMGDMSSFIGGVDGRSGADASDLASYRASVGQVLFSGTPRSLTERMMMEDAMAQRRAAAQGQQP